MMMMRTWTIAAAVMLAAACSDGATDPGPAEETPQGVDFGIAAGTFGAHQSTGTLPAGQTPLGGEFSVAVPDSLGGLIVVSYDQTTSDLFILQVQSRQTGTYECGPVTAGLPCHGRYFENVREEEGVVRVDGQLDLTTGTLVVTGTGGSLLTGSFQASLERTAGTGDPVIDVQNGSISVRLLEGPVVNGGLTCLIELAGAATTCSD